MSSLARISSGDAALSDRRRTLISVPVPHLLVFSQQHVTPEGDGLMACFLLGVGLGDDHLADQFAASDLVKGGGDSYRIRCGSRRRATRNARRDGQDRTCTDEDLHVEL